jgi:hypothetical protein
MEIMLKNKCCLYVIISIRFFSITICNLLIELPSHNPNRLMWDVQLTAMCGKNELPNIKTGGKLSNHSGLKG